MKKKTVNAQLAQVLPSDEDLEKAVLGAILIEKTAFERVSDLLTADDFYSQNHSNVFAAMLHLSRQNQPIDTLTVGNAMREIGGFHDGFKLYDVVKLTNSVVSSANLEHHAAVVVSLAQRRRLYSVCMEDAQRAISLEHEIRDTLQEHDGAITKLMNSGPNNNMSHVDSVISDAISRVAELRSKDSHITGTPSGFRELDRLTHGWQDSDLIVLAARPSMGKTAFALRLLRNAVGFGKCGAFFSLEMSKGQLINRLLSSESGVFLDKLVSGRVSNDEMTMLVEAGSAISKLPIFIDDTPGLGIMELKSKARRLKRKHDLGILLIDYMQLITDHSKNNREQEISNISRSLKALAKELSIPIIALCQLSREVEKRSNKNPQLSDLRESGAIEQDADMVMFMYRPEYYDVTSDDMGESTAGLCELSIAKHRNGELDKVKLKSNLGIQKFYDWEGSTGKAPGSSFIPITTLVKVQSDLPF